MTLEYNGYFTELGQAQWNMQLTNASFLHCSGDLHLLFLHFWATLQKKNRNINQIFEVYTL